MHVTKNTILTLTALLLCFNFLNAKVKLPSVFNDHMVLQQNAKIKIWGWANPGENISVTSSWSKEKSTIANSKGAWHVWLKTLGYKSKPQQIKITGENSITINNILFGEVWLCSGQSNMEFTIKTLGGWDSQWYAKSKEVIDSDDYSKIRIFNVGKSKKEGKQNDCSGEWKKANAATVEEFSAAAWFFGLKLYQELGIPIGLINAAWGGTGAEVWTPRNLIAEDKQLHFYLDAPNASKWGPGKPGVLYDNMIYPILNYKFKGVIWYQGETNRKGSQPAIYHYLLTKMIRSWRKKFNHKFPFYLVQIAPFGYDEIYAGALIREGQLKVDELVPKTEMAVTMDIAALDDIHPKNKQDVGKRLALWALKNEYKKNDIVASGPVFYKMKKPKEGIVELLFKNATGLHADATTLSLFEIAGKNQVFYPAEAKIKREKIILKSSDVPQPVAVRYAFKSAAMGGLYNSAELPASSFRTDQWKIKD